MTTVGTKRAPYTPEPNDFYVGRPSKWGNPFVTGKHAKTREECVELFRIWITTGDGRYLLKDLHELRGKRLICWCYPRSCHADVLTELVDTLYPDDDVVS